MMRWLSDKWDKMLLLMLAAFALFAYFERRLSATVLVAFMLIYFVVELGWGGGKEFDWDASRKKTESKLNSAWRHRRSGRPRYK
jgi:hypothetical protein